MAAFRYLLQYWQQLYILKLPRQEQHPSMFEGIPKPHWCKCCCFDVYPYLILLGIMFLTFGYGPTLLSYHHISSVCCASSYWVFDTPGAIFTQLQDWFGPSYTASKNLNLCKEPLHQRR